MACWNALTSEDKYSWHAEAAAAGYGNYYAYFMHVTVPIFLAGDVPDWCRPYPPAVGIYEFYRGIYSMNTMPVLPANIQNGDFIKLGVWVCHVDLWRDPEPGDSDTLKLSVSFKQMHDEMPSFEVGIDVLGDSACTGYTYYENTGHEWFKGFYKVANHSGMKWSYLTYEVASPEGAKVFDTCYFFWNAVVNKPWPVANGALWLGPRHIYHNGQLIYTDWTHPTPETDPAPGAIGWSPRVINPNRTPWTRYDKAAPVCFG